MREQRIIKFRAWLPSVGRMLDRITIFPDMIGIDAYEFDDVLKPDFHINDEKVSDKEHTTRMHVLCGEDWYWIESHYYELMQFTGLVDSKGVEIYESDRILFGIQFWENNAAWSQHGFEGTVYFDKYEWKIKDIRFTKMYDQDYVFKMQERQWDRDLLERYSKIRNVTFKDISQWEGFEVVGNIYQEQSPELLNTTKEI
jgi:uncharacterized phage protein (TIGR01671 family)